MTRWSEWKSSRERPVLGDYIQAELSCDICDKRGDIKEGFVAGVVPSGVVLSPIPQVTYCLNAVVRWRRIEDGEETDVEDELELGHA